MNLDSCVDDEGVCHIELGDVKWEFTHASGLVIEMTLDEIEELKVFLRYLGQ